MSTTPNTTLDAVNFLLSAAGEAPIDSLAAPSNDVRVALQLLEHARRGVTSRKWTFNTARGHQISPTAYMRWHDITGGVTTLAVFTPPANLLSFEMTNRPDQQGVQYLDVAIQPSQRYKVDGKSVPVFFDRSRSRDGFERTALYVDPVWNVPFEHMPEAARYYVLIQAARKFVQHVVGSASQAQFQEADELMALRTLEQQYDRPDSLNILNNSTVLKHFGQRPLGPSGVWDRRSTVN